MFSANQIPRGDHSSKAMPMRIDEMEMEGAAATHNEASGKHSNHLTKAEVFKKRIEKGKFKSGTIAEKAL